MYVDSYHISPIYARPSSPEGLFYLLNMGVKLTDAQLKKLAGTRRHELRYLPNIYLTIDRLGHPDYELHQRERLILEHIISSDIEVLRNTCYFWGEIYSPVMTQHKNHNLLHKY